MYFRSASACVFQSKINWYGIVTEYSTLFFKIVDHALYRSWQQDAWGQYGAHLGPTGASWAPCWPHDLCYLGIFHADILHICPIHTYIYVYISYDMCILLSFSFPISLCNRQKWKCKETNIFAGAIRELHTKWISLSDGILTFIIPRCIIYPLDKTQSILSICLNAFCPRRVLPIFLRHACLFNDGNCRRLVSP